MATYTTLRYGSTGEDVKKLQQSLGITADGIYGKQTEAAVRDYQKKNGLTVDGIAGNQTFGKLYGSSTATAPATTTTTQPSAYKYEEFKYDPYTKSDAVKDAYAMVDQYMQNKPGEFNYSWQAQLDDIYNKIMNREDFSYDLNGDALYQQYKDQYTTQGKLASMDSMGQAAAMTGGFGNSYAQSVGQQTYQGYLQQLNDKVPELYQLARSQYDKEEQSLYNQASLLGQQKEQEYGMYRDKVSDYYTELQFLTDKADTLSKEEYDKWLDDINLRYGIHSDTQKAGSDARSDATDLALSMLGMGVMPSNDILAAAGLSSADAQAIYQKANESSDTTTSDTSKKEDKAHGFTTEEIKSLQKAAGITVDGIWGPQTEAAYQQGYRPVSGTPNNFTVLSYNQAVDYIKKNGGDATKINQLIPSKEFKMAQQDGATFGGVSLKNMTYAEYLKEFCEWAVS